MRLQKLFIACSGSLLLTTAPFASAEQTWHTESAGDFTFSANVALTSDYVWRYASQSDEKGAIQGGFDVSHSTGLYAGTWGSNVDFNDGGDSAAALSDPSMELDLYGGFAHEFDMGLGIDVGVINYRYPGAHADWVEYYGGLNYTVMGIGLSGSVNWSNDVFNSNENGTFYSLAADYTFDTTYPITVSADWGYYDLDDFADELNLNQDSYKGYHIGAAVDIHGFTLDASYYNTTDHKDAEDALAISGTNWADSRFVATISTSF